MCICAQNTYITPIYIHPFTLSHTPHMHTHTTHFGNIPHCVGGTPQQVGQGTSDLEESDGEEPTPGEGGLSQEEREW